MDSNIKTSRAVTYRHALLYTQVLFFLILLLSGHITQTLAQAAYCIVVFTSPLLLLLYGSRYMRQNAWCWTAIPFLVEVVLTVLFLGAMIYGILLHDSSSVLFTKLLMIYIVDAALCVLGFFGASTI